MPTPILDGILYTRKTAHYILLKILIIEDELHVLYSIHVKFCLYHISLYVYVNGQRHYNADFADKT